MRVYNSSSCHVNGIFCYLFHTRLTRQTLMQPGQSQNLKPKTSSRVFVGLLGMFFQPPLSVYGLDKELGAVAECCLQSLPNHMEENAFLCLKCRKWSFFKVLKYYQEFVPTTVVSTVVNRFCHSLKESLSFSILRPPRGVCEAYLHQA